MINLLIKIIVFITDMLQYLQTQVLNYYSQI
jgi:hypothetical protein